MMTEDPLRARLADAFAAPLDAAIKNYGELVAALDAAKKGDDPRTDAARHAACRAALQHVLTLIKVADVARAPAKTAATGGDASRLLAEARLALGTDRGGTS